MLNQLKKYNSFILAATIMLIPSVGRSSGHNIESEITYFLPWLIWGKQVTVERYGPSSIVLVQPIYIALIMFIPSIYMLKHAYLLQDGNNPRDKHAALVAGYSLVQMVFIYATYLSIETDEEITFIPYAFLLSFLVYGILAGIWFVRDTQKRLDASESL